MEFKTPWWFGIVVVLFLGFAGYQAYLQQRSLFRFADAQMMAVNLEVIGAQSPRRYADLNDRVADAFGVMSGYTGTLDRSKIHFAPAALNGNPGFAYTITIAGLSKRDCQDFEPNVLFFSVQVNGQLIDRSAMTVDDIHNLCHSAVWPWSRKNTVILTGS